MTLWQQTWKLLSFMGIQYSLGRRGSYPYGLLINYSLVHIGILVLLCDAIQTLTLLTLLSQICQRVPWLRKRFEKKRLKRNNLPESSWRNHLYRHRFTTMILISALPYGGGSLSGSFFALSTDSPKLKSFICIITGCSLGTLLYHAVFAGLF